jgi:hypothetical protein
VVVTHARGGGGLGGAGARERDMQAHWHSLELLDRIGQVPRRARTCRPAEKEHISTAEHVFRFRPSKGTP